MNTALLVVDVQKIYTDPGSELYCEDAKKTVQKINKLIRHFQQEKLPIILIRHIHKADGSDLGRMFDFSGEPEEDFNFKENTIEVEYDDNLIKPNDSIEITKNRYSAFIGTKLDSLLRKLSVKKVVICGFMTNCCCESTARDAHDLDYFVDFILDATGTPGTEKLDQKQIKSIVAQLLIEGFALVVSTNKFLKV